MYFSNNKGNRFRFHFLPSRLANGRYRNMQNPNKQINPMRKNRQINNSLKRNNKTIHKRRITHKIRRMDKNNSKLQHHRNHNLSQR